MTTNETPKWYEKFPLNWVAAFFEMFSEEKLQEAGVSTSKHTGTDDVAGETLVGVLDFQFPEDDPRNVK